MTDTNSLSSSNSVGLRASRPSEIPPRGLGQVAGRIVQRLGETRLSLIAAGIAFFGLLAIFPALTALVAVAGLILTPDAVATQLGPMIDALPPAAAEIVSGQITEVAAANNSGLNWTLVIGVGLALFSASRGTLHLINGLNVAYEEDEDRGFFKLQLLGILITLCTVVGMTLALTVAAALPIVADMFFRTSLLADIMVLLRWPFLLLVAIAAFAALYRFAPSRRAARWRWITPGALSAVAIWIAATIGFSWYAQTFGSYSETFGALAGVVILMMWLFLTSFAVLIGALIDAELEAQTGRDNTVGGDQPIGQRGAVKADQAKGLR
ncbi:YihY/virulence factor BrkB family protein [Tropicimonas sp. S265A]|uniref:YihY/virulence factor BrkB family protein n=1 Tax=Tropicimonas sp. S265A TaxID=3415134 RepID=UPI003C7E948A